MKTPYLEKRGIILAENGQLRAAETTFKKILTNDRWNLCAHFELSRIYRRLRMFNKGIYHSHCVLKIKPSEPNANLNLGLNYEEKGNLRNARLYYKKELELNPYSGEALYNLGFSYFDNKRWRQAARYLERCLNVGFQFERVRIVEALAFCYHRLRNAEAYLQLFREYLVEAPMSGWAAFNLGSVLMALGEFRKSALMFEKARRLGFAPEKAVEKFRLAKENFVLREKG